MTPVRDVMVIGGSQAGLSASYRLSQLGIDHLVLERHDHVGHAWSHERWDSFTLVTPNWFLDLPDHPYRGDAPDAFLPRDGIVGYLEGFYKMVRPPIHFGVDVTGLHSEHGHYRIETACGSYRARHVIVATGFFHRSRILAMAAHLPPGIIQLDPYSYRSPDDVPEGGVLIVGSSMSGIQICEDFIEEGRPVWLAVGDGLRMPRRYRGRDAFAWMVEMGWLDKPLNLETHAERYNPSFMLSGARGGRGINLHSLAARGTQLLGRLEGIDGNKASFSDDLDLRVAQSDAAGRNFAATVDEFIGRQGLTVPDDAASTDGGDPGAGGPYNPPTRVDLEALGIRSVIWATGFACDYDWIDMPVLDGRGFPRQLRGVSDIDGLYFCGQHWLHTFASGGFRGLGDDPAHIAGHIRRRLDGVSGSTR